MMNKVALITGSSKGIGKAIAMAFAKQGYDIILNGGHNKELLEITAKEIRDAYGVPCDTYLVDVGNHIEVKEMIASIHSKYPVIDVLVNNAGISHLGLLTDMSEDEWDRIYNTNVKSMFNLTKYVLPPMVRHKRGSVINISSMWGVCGASCEVAYSASKGAMNAFTKALAKELAPSGIRVNAIACGAIDTEMNQWMSKEERDALEEDIPMGRLGRTEEVANLALSLADNDTAYLTGQVLVMDGGYL